MVFEGRASRSEYWWFALFIVLVYIACALVGAVIGDTATSVLFILAVCALFLPQLAVTIRRLHDTSKSGWWYLITLVPYAGSIVLLIFMVIAGTPGPNQYGPSPMGNGLAQPPAPPALPPAPPMPPQPPAQR